MSSQPRDCCAAFQGRWIRAAIVLDIRRWRGILRLEISSEEPNAGWCSCIAAGTIREVEPSRFLGACSD